MTHIRNLPIMPKQTQARTSARNTMPSLAPYPEAPQPPQKVAAIWSSSDDEILLQARASGLNWQPIANRYFPNKSANACRKRHERLVERRHGDDWDTYKLELLATEYMACRKEMWEVLAARVGERWLVVEAKVSYHEHVLVSELLLIVHHSVWKKASKRCKQQRDWHRGKPRQPTNPKKIVGLYQITTATLALVLGLTRS